MIRKEPSQKRPRILTFDIIRGLFLIVIIINHFAVSFGPSLLVIITGASQLPASAAEGFFLISGIMAGYVYGPKILTKRKETFLKMWKRAGILWFLCVFFTLLFTAWTLLYPESEKYSTLYSRDGINFLYNTFLLRFSFGWADFLSRYAWFMFIAPFALWLIAKRAWWLVALISTLIWALFRHTELLLPFSAWQILFVAGLIIGYYFPLLTKKAEATQPAVKSVLISICISVSVMTFAISIISFVMTPLIIHYFPAAAASPLATFAVTVQQLLQGHIGKDSLDPLRMIIGALWFFSIYVIIRRHEHTINTVTAGVVQTLGRNALFVYCLHALILFSLDIYLKPIEGTVGIFLNTLIALLIVTGIYLITHYRSTLGAIALRPFHRILRS